MDIRMRRFRHGLLGLVLGSALVFTGCAASGPKGVDTGAGGAEGTEEAALAQAAEETISIEYINVVGDGDRVLIGATGTLRYTVFKLSDPPRLIVDLPGVNLDKVSEPFTVDNDYLSDISAASYGDEENIGRIVVGLKEGVDHEVKSGENSLLVSLSMAGAATEEEAAVIEEPLVEEEVDSEIEDMAGAVEVLVPEDDIDLVEAEPLEPASKVVDVSSAKDGENTVITITANGAVKSYNSFSIDSPDRLVIDLWGLKNTVPRNRLAVNEDFVKGVRIGQHPDKVRLVVDSSVKTLPPHSITREGTSIVLTLGPNVVQIAEELDVEPAPVMTAQKAVEAVAAPVEPGVEAEAALVVAEEMGEAEALDEEAEEIVEEESAPVEAEEMAEEESAPVVAEEVVEAEPGPPAVRVEAVDFKRVDKAGRLTISSSEKTEFRVTESKDGRRIVIDLKDAVVPASLIRTLDASRLKTPVASISSYQEAGGRVKVARILVKLKEKVVYDINEYGDTINIDFTSKAATQAAKAEKAVAVEAAEEAVDEGPKKKYTGRKIDLDMMDANIGDVLRLLAEVSNFNIIASDDVRGTISLRLKNVPWDQAFDIILKSKDLGKTVEGNVVRVAPSSRIRREREATLAARKAAEKLEPLSTKFVAINYANAVELKTQVKGVLTERGTVEDDTRTNTLIIRDLGEGIDAAVNLITRLDTPIPQVLIEARIVEATTSFARDLGIQWGADYGTGGRLTTLSGGATGTTGNVTNMQAPANAVVTPDTNNQYAVNLPASGTAGTLGALGFILGKAGQNPLILDLRLTAGEQQGRLKTISRPRITTLDNTEAKIEQGESIPFETTSAEGKSTSFIDANLSLTVKPHITPDGSVLMKIKASRNSIGSFRTSSGEPSINKKESSTEVLVKDGETTVIGGIVITDKVDNSSGIPFFKDIPVIGWLFKSKSVTDTQTELLIFITPTIIKDKTVG